MEPPEVDDEGVCKAERGVLVFLIGAIAITIALLFASGSAHGAEPLKTVTDEVVAVQFVPNTGCGGIYLGKDTPYYSMVNARKMTVDGTKTDFRGFVKWANETPENQAVRVTLSINENSYCPIRGAAFTRFTRPPLELKAVAAAPEPPHSYADAVKLATEKHQPLVVYTLYFDTPAVTGAVVYGVRPGGLGDPEFKAGVWLCVPWTGQMWHLQPDDKRIQSAVDHINAAVPAPVALPMAPAYIPQPRFQFRPLMLGGS